MPPAAAQPPGTVSVHFLASHQSGAAVSRVVVHPPRIMVLDQDHRRRALDALIELLAAVVDRDDAAPPGSPSPVP